MTPTFQFSDLTGSIQPFTGSLGISGCPNGLNNISATPQNTTSADGTGQAFRIVNGTPDPSRVLHYRLLRSVSPSDLAWGNVSTGGAPNRLPLTVTGNTGIAAGSFYIKDNGNPTMPMRGTYRDTVNLAMDTGASPQTMNVEIVVPDLCVVNFSPSATLALNYTAFGASVSSSMTAQITCNNPYDLFLDEVPCTQGASQCLSSGTLNSVSYGLTLAPSGGQALTTTNHTITATAAGGQPGSCPGPGSCNQERTHTLHIVH